MLVRLRHVSAPSSASRQWRLRSRPRCRGWAADGCGRRGPAGQLNAIGRRDRALTGGHGFALAAEQSSIPARAIFEAHNEKLVEGPSATALQLDVSEPARPSTHEGGQPLRLADLGGGTQVASTGVDARIDEEPNPRCADDRADGFEPNSQAGLDRDAM